MPCVRSSKIMNIARPQAKAQSSNFGIQIAETYCFAS